jgi:hypothetical protein
MTMIKTITISRKELYDKVWQQSIPELCKVYDVPEEGFGEICRRLNIPMPDKGYWRKLEQGKKATPAEFPEQAHGVGSLTISLRDDDRKEADYQAKLAELLNHMGSTQGTSHFKVLDSLVRSTQEGMFLNWKTRHDKYQSKNKCWPCTFPRRDSPARYSLWTCL